MPSLIIKKYRSSEKSELTFESVEDLSVRELRENVSSKLGMSLDDLKLVYGGRVLKVGKTVVEYKIVSGCTIYIMATRTNRGTKDHRSRGRSGGGFMNNRRVLTLIGRVLSNPGLLQDMAQGIEMASGSTAMLQLLGSQQVLSGLSDPDNIREYICQNPDIGHMMEHMIRQFLGSSIEGTLEEQDEEQLVDLLESQLEEEMAQVEEEGEAQRAQAQEQMFEHSQALHAHNQQQRQQSHTPSTSAPETSYNPLPSRQHGTISPAPAGSGPITHDQLVSALANAMASSSSPSPRINASPLLNASPLASLNRSSSDHASAPPPYSTAIRNSQQPGGGGGATAPGPISAATLQQVLANVVGMQGSGDGRGARVQGSSGGGSHSSDRTRYYAQLEQLRLMGIEDEIACLHALAATGGDLQAALEILYSQ